MSRNWISCAAVLLACLALVSAVELVANNHLTPLPLPRSYKVLLWMYEYRNPNNRAKSGMICDIPPWFAEIVLKCDVQIWLTLTNKESGESSQVVYPEVNKHGDNNYGNTDHIDVQTFLKTGSIAAVNFSEIAGKQVFIKMRIIDIDITSDDLIAENSFSVTIDGPPNTWSPIKSIGFHKGIQVSVKLALKCEADTCDPEQCYKLDNWRACEHERLTCLHLPFVNECIRLAGNFRFALKLKDVILQEKEECEETLRLCIAGLTEKCHSENFTEIYHSLPSASGSKHPIQSTTNDYQRNTNRLERKLKLLILIHKQCGQEPSTTAEWQFDYDISKTTVGTYKNIAFGLQPNSHILIRTTLIVACADGFSGLDCQSKIN